MLIVFQVTWKLNKVLGEMTSYTKPYNFYVIIWYFRNIKNCKSLD